jgi:hypothetical protein
VLAVLVFVMSVVSAFLAGPEQPHWYQAILSIAMPLAVISGARFVPRVRALQHP